MIKQRISTLKKQKQLREDDKFFFIPWYEHFPILSEYIPGLQKGHLVKILSPTGVY